MVIIYLLSPGLLLLLVQESFQSPYANGAIENFGSTMGQPGN